MEALKNWIPVKLLRENNAYYCQWLYAGTSPFTEPFFDDTLFRIKREHPPQRRFKSLSALSMLSQWGESLKPVQASGIIFHVSRCGSTLLSQLVSLNQKNVALSEVPFFDELLRARHREEADENYPLLFEKAAHWYGQDRGERLFIKTDSWHLFFYDIYRSVFPDIPFVLLYRSPDEVIRSQQKRRGLQAVPGMVEPSVFGFTTEEAACTDLDRYMAMVLEKYFLRMLQIAEQDKQVLLCNYNEGFEKISKSFLSLAGVPLQEEDLRFIEERCRYHGKYPEQGFVKETEPLPQAAYLERPMELYRQLEEKRKARL